MTSDEVKTWVRENLDRKAREFGLPHWRISVSYDRLDDRMAQVTSFPERERAAITIDVSAFEDEPVAELEHAVEHELMHIVHSPFDLFRHSMHDAGMNEDQWNSLMRLFDDCCEMTVRNMERMTFSLREAKNARIIEQIEEIRASKVAEQTPLALGELNGHASPPPIKA